MLGYTGFIACLLHYPQNMTSIFSRSFWSRKTLIFFAICMMLMTVKMFYSFFLWDNSPVRLVTARALYQILHSSDLRSDYQVIDVRESKELIDLSIDGIGVINLPLSEKNSWRFKISQLNPMLPTICFCASGRRSILAAKYLGESCWFCDISVCYFACCSQPFRIQGC